MPLNVPAIIAYAYANVTPVATPDATSTRNSTPTPTTRPSPKSDASPTPRPAPNSPELKGHSGSVTWSLIVNDPTRLNSARRSHHGLTSKRAHHG